MDIKNTIEKIRAFIDTQAKNGRQITVYKRNKSPDKFFKDISINVELDGFIDIILQEETKLELGGVYKKSFSLIYPIHVSEFIQNGTITLIGPETNKFLEQSVDFGLFMLIAFNKISEKDFDNLRHFNFVSNGIEGFMIRTIPRKFWCRINSKVNDRFTLEFLGNAIMHLYEEKFKDIIKSMEIIFLSSDQIIIDEFVELTSEITEHMSKRWTDKIDEWKKRIDCDYDWECSECPYEDTCEDVKEVLEERNKL